MGSVFSNEKRPPIHRLSSLIPDSPEFKNLCDDLAREGFAVIGIGGEHKDVIEMQYKITKQFFELDKEIKMKNEDPKQEGLGYVGSNKWKEYLKLRIHGDRNKNFPEEPKELKEAFTDCLGFFHKITWPILQELNAYTLKYTDPQTKPFTDLEWQGIEQAVVEIGSIGVTHYYPRPDGGDALVDICNAHKDTGILTFVMVSEVPGLQVLDRKNNNWFDIERLLHPQRSKQNLLVVLMGEKIHMFTGSSVLKPTEHRVMVPPETRRDSLLYFMDVSY